MFTDNYSVKYLRAVVVVIVWYLDLQLPMQSVPTTTKIVSLNPAHGKVYKIKYTFDGKIFKFGTSYDERFPIYIYGKTV
jgi:hypothetical protein